MLLKSAIRYILFRKAEQLGLFDIPVPIKPYVRDGKVIAGHVAKRKKRIAPKGKQPDLFGAAEPQGEAVKLGRLGHFIEKHGGYGRLHAMLQGYTDDQRNTLLDSMAKLAGKTRAEVVDILDNGAKHEAPKAPAGDLFDGVEAEAPRQESDKAKEPWEMTRAQYFAGMNAGKKMLDRDLLIDRKGNGPTFRYTPFDVGGEQFFAVEMDNQGWSRGKSYKIHNAAGDVVQSLERAGKAISVGDKFSSRKDLIKKFTALLGDGWHAKDSYYRGLRQALSAGKPVPAEVLADYPDLQASPKDNQGRDLAAVKRVDEPKEGDTKLTPGQEGHFRAYNRHSELVGRPILTRAEFKQQLPRIKAEEKARDLRAKAKKLGQEANAAIDSIPMGHKVTSSADRNKRDRAADKLRQHGELIEQAEAIEASLAPKEGDTKTENGIEYRLQDGRWHRVTPEGSGEKQEFRYALINRPAGFAQVPDGYVRVDERPAPGQAHHEAARNGIVVYPRQLSADDVRKWELAPILDGAALQQFADKVAGEYGQEEAAYLLEVFDEDADIVRQQLVDDMDRVGKEYGATPSVGDIDAFVDQVIEALKSRSNQKQKPTLTPTHELPDGTQVIAHADEANVWVDAQGDEYESEEAYPLSPQDPVRDTAREKLDTAKEAGVITPDEHQAASEALDSEGPAAAKAAIDRKRKADKLRKVAQNLMDKAQAAQNQDRNTNTARRARMAGNILARAAHEEATARTMLNLADAIEAGEAPHLEGMNSMAAVQTLDAVLQRARSKYEEVNGWTYDRSKRESGRPWGEDDIRFVMWPDTTIRKDWIPSLQGDLRQARGGKALADEVRHGNLTQDLYDRMVNVLGEHKVDSHVGWYAADRLKDIARLKRAGITGTEDLQAAVREYVQFKAGRKAIDPVKAAEMALAGQKVGIDFFPTPKVLADRMAELADIEPGMKVLEPSAGKGNLADAAKARGADVDVVEVSDALRNVLQAKGYSLVDRDFNDYEPGEVYDRIIMNPPFGKGTDRQDAVHIQRAYQMLKPGGKLVSIAGEGVFIGSDQKASAFRDWLNQRGAMIEKLPDNSFMDRAETHVTGAATRLVVIEKPVGAKAADDAHAQIADKAIESVNTLIMARKEQARGADMNTLPYVNAVQKAIEFLERKGDTQNAQRIRDAIAQGEKEAGRSLLDDGPQEGERNAEGLVFHDGRWHREDDPEARTAAIDDQLDAEEAQRLNPPEATPEPTPEPARPDPLERLRAQIEAMGGKAQVAENLRAAFKNRFTRLQADAVIKELVDATGLDRDTVLAEMGIKEVVRKPAGERTRPDTLSTGGEYTDDDPNSPNYRFRDTGYIGDSRKELAAESIREHARNGQRLRATDIDWQQIEQNPRQAKELITKSNLFGKVDWEALKANGMEPATGFLIDRVYASIAPEPSTDDAQARKDYAVGLETLRDRLESCKTPENVTEVLEELRDEYDGIIFNEREKAAYEQAEAIYREINTRRWDLKKEREVLSAAVTRISGRINELSWQNERRERRKWKRDPDIDRQIEELRPEQAAAMHALESWEAAHPEALNKYETKTRRDALGIEHVSMENTGDLVQQERAAFEVMQTIKAFSLSRNREENPLHRAWRLMGPRFLTVLKWRSGKNAFQGHVTSAKTGKVKDWSWAEKQHVTAPRSTEGKVRFQLRVAENFSRVGGRPVEVNSTDELKHRFGLRDVQSGNWVLTDPESAAFHVQHAAEALSDLSDLLGIPEDKLFVNGRVALAFGARGTGNAGFGGAARAHYERIFRVINLTKLGGGGALAHELFHAIDNLAKEAETGQPGDAEDFITDNPDLLPDGPLKQAVRGLRSAMLDGDKRLWQTLKYTANDARLAKHNLDRAAPSKMAAAIKDAPDLESALLAIDGFYPNGWASKRTEKQREEWRRIAAAWHDGMKPEGGKARARAGAPVSDFTYQAHLLDGGQYGKYWSTTREMAARAFQAWCEDRLSDQGRKNDYLSAFADNQYYKDPIFGDSKPFPEGRERERINAAIDDLVYALRQSGTLQKAFELLAA